MSPDHEPTPATIIGALLTSHPEAASLLAEASHWRALAVCSTVFTRVKFTAAQAARLAYEELRHRLEPRRRHPVHFGLGLLLLLAVGAGLTMLILIGSAAGSAAQGRRCPHWPPPPSGSPSPGWPCWPSCGGAGPW